MNRIEETTRQICELGDLTHEYAINLANMVDRRDKEIKRLFSKLEIAERALELAVNELDEHDRNEHMEHGDFCSEYKPCAELTAINEALQQIRE